MRKNIALVLVVTLLSSFNNIDFSNADSEEIVAYKRAVEIAKKGAYQRPSSTSSFKELASESSISSGKFAVSLGLDNRSAKDFSLTTGLSNTALSRFSQAHGRNSEVRSDFSYAFGDSSIAAGFHSYAHGKRNTSKGLFSYAFGKDNESKGKHAIAFGRRNKVSNDGLAIGTDNKITGESSSAIGKNNDIVSKNSVALGNKNAIHGDNSFSLGSGNEIYADNSYAFGKNISSGAANNFTIGSTNSRLYNDIASSLMVGFNSNVPTLFVSSSYGDQQTGTVGIGTHKVNRTVSLHVKGPLLLDDGNQRKNAILTSDDNGKAKWSNPKSLGIVVRDKKTKSREKYVDDLHKKIKTDEKDGDISIGDENRPPAVYVDNEEDYNEETKRSTYSSNVGIGTSNPQQKLHVSGAMRLEPQAIAPKNAAAGDIYYDQSGAFCGYVVDPYGYGSWEKMIGSGECHS